MKCNINMIIGLTGSPKHSFIKEKVKQDERNKINTYVFRVEEFNTSELYYKALKTFLSDSINCEELPNETISIYLDNIDYLKLAERRKVFDLIAQFADTLQFYVTAYILALEIEECIRHKIKKEAAIYKEQTLFNIPFYEEGFNDIEIIDGASLKPVMVVRCDDQRFAEEFYKMVTFNQDIPHHTYTLGVHMAVAQKHVYDRREDFYDFPHMYIAAMVHDWGKFFTKTYNEQGKALYYDHGEVGAYYLLTHLNVIPVPERGVTADDILKILFFVNYHMRPFDFLANDLLLHEAEEIYGAHNLHDLVVFNHIDKISCGAERDS